MLCRNYHHLQRSYKDSHVWFIEVFKNLSIYIELEIEFLMTDKNVQVSGEGAAQGQSACLACLRSWVPSPESLFKKKRKEKKPKYQEGARRRTAASQSGPPAEGGAPVGKHQTAPAFSSRPARLAPDSTERVAGTTRVAWTRTSDCQVSHVARRCSVPRGCRRGSPAQSAQLPLRHSFTAACDGVTVNSGLANSLFCERLISFPGTHAGSATHAVQFTMLPGTTSVSKDGRTGVQRMDWQAA